MKLNAKRLAELKNAVDQFNKKIGEYPPGVILPQYKDLNAEIHRIEEWGYNEYKRSLSSMKQFIQSPPEVYTTESGTNITLWEKKQIDKAFRKINKQRSDLIKRYEISPYTGTMGEIEMNNLRPRENTVEKILPKNWDKYVARTLHTAYEPMQIRNKAYKENYLKAVEEQYGKDNALYRLAQKISPRKMIEGLYTNPFLSITFVYDPHENYQYMMKAHDEWVNLLGGRNII